MKHYEIKVRMTSGEQIFVISEREKNKFIETAEKFGWKIQFVKFIG